MLILRATDVDDTRAIAAAVAALSRTGDLIVLAGEMGAGKTTFAKGFGEALGVDEPVTSPTYTLVHTYDADDVALHHADLYRLDHTTEVSDLAFDELLDDGIVLVEWGDAVDLGPNLQIWMHPRHTRAGDEARDIEITCTDARWQTRWPRLQASLGRWESS